MRFKVLCGMLCLCTWVGCGGDDPPLDAGMTDDGGTVTGTDGSAPDGTTAFDAGRDSGTPDATTPDGATVTETVALSGTVDGVEVGATDARAEPSTACTDDGLYFATSGASLACGAGALS